MLKKKFLVIHSVFPLLFISLAFQVLFVLFFVPAPYSFQDPSSSAGVHNWTHHFLGVRQGCVLWSYFLQIV